MWITWPPGHRVACAEPVTSKLQDFSQFYKKSEGVESFPFSLEKGITEAEYYISIVYLDTAQKKWSLPLRIPSVNVTKSVVSCGFRHIYWILNGKLYFFVQSEINRSAENSETSRIQQYVKYLYSPWADTFFWLHSGDKI